MNSKGKLGEIEAFKYLKRKRYNLITSNFSSRFGEIDLIVQNKKYICFVEVKERDCASSALPKEFVDENKQRKIIKTAQYYLMLYPTKKQPRFDVVEIYTDNNTIKSIKHLENAFQLY